MFCIKTSKCAKKWLAICITLAVLLSLMPVTPAAAVNYSLTPGALPYSAAISDANTADIHSFTIAQAGRLTLNIARGTGTGLTSANIAWRNSSTVIIRSLSNVSIPGSGNYTDYMDLEPGTYTIEVSRYSTVNGDYDISVSFIPAGNSDNEPNDRHEDAQTLTNGVWVTGFLSHGDPADYFEYVLTSARRLTLETGRASPLNIGGATVSWYNAGRVLIRSSSFAGTDYMDLEAGTYYIGIEKQSSYTGTYSLRVSETSPASVNITLTAGTGGFVSGGGTFLAGNTVTITATPDVGYSFDGWYESGSKVSPNATWSFTADASRTLEAQFKQSTTCTVTITASPRNGGVLYGGGVVSMGAQTQVAAAPNSGYRFDGWYENGVLLTQSQAYAFTPTADMALEARFNLINTSQQIIANNHSSWAKAELIRALELDLIPASIMDPSVDYTQPIRRHEFAGVVVKVYESLSGAVVKPASENPFTDTSLEDVLKAYQENLMVGISATRFDPNSYLTREQAATGLTRAFKRWHFTDWSYAQDARFPLTFQQPALFADHAQISNWALESVYFMFANNIIEGVGSNTFAPRATTTAQSAIGYGVTTREHAIVMALRIVDNL